MAITHMTQYQNYSFEELRVQDYEAGRKKAQPGAGGFGAAAGGFGAPAAAPAFGGGAFGAAPAAGGFQVSSPKSGFKECRF